MTKELTYTVEYSNGIKEEGTVPYFGQISKALVMARLFKSVAKTAMDKKLGLSAFEFSEKNSLTEKALRVEAKNIMGPNARKSRGFMEFTGIKALRKALKKMG